QPMNPTGSLHSPLAQTTKKLASMIAPQFVSHVSGRHQPFRTGNTAAKRDFSSAHLVGICGSGMKALAELLVDLGWSVTGSDLQAAGPSMQLLERRGLRLHRGHNDDYVPRQVDVLVYSPAVGPSNPERQRAQQLGIPQMSYSQMLG